LSSSPSTKPASALSRLDTLPVDLPELTLGWEAAKWSAKYLRQPNGPRAGERFRFTTRQLRFLLHWYAVREDGSWVYHHGARRLAKGSGKSPYAAALALIEFLAPVRLKDFDPDAPGGCVGRPVAMPLVQIAAVSEDQTEHTMRMVRAFAKKGSRLVNDYGLDPGLTRYNSADGRLHVMTSSAKTAEGGEATFIVGDETEWWLGKDGAEFMNTLADNLAKSGSRMCETNNAWKPGAGGAWKPDGSGGSQAEATWDTFVKQEEDLLERGSTKSGSLMLYDAVIAPPETDMADPESLERALRFVYADCEWKTDQEIRAIMTRIWHRSSRADDSKRKYLNWPTASEDAWADPQKWMLLAADGVDGRPKRELVEGERIGIFFDGSKTRDATAALGVCMSDGHVFKIGVWEPKDEVPVDAEAIDNRMIWAFEYFSVVAFFSDVREWEGFAKVTWPERWKEQLEVWAVPGGKMPEPIAWDMRSHSKDFALAAELVEAEIEEGSFTHDGDPIVARHVGNARRYETRWNGAISVKKETPNSPDKIDACVCVIGARMVYRIALAGSEPVEPSEAFFVKRW
jgi:hypothetical protein